MSAIPSLRELSLRACLRQLPSYSHNRENTNSVAAQILNRIDNRLPDALSHLSQTASIETASSPPEANTSQATPSHLQEARLTQPSLLDLLKMMQRGKKLVHAALNNNLELVLNLLEDGSVSESDRGLAVRHAVLNDHFVMVEKLLENGPISEPDRGSAVAFAAFNENFQITEILLENGSIPQRDRNKALFSARCNQNLSLYELLSKAETPHSPPRKQRKIDD